MEKEDKISPKWVSMKSHDQPSQVVELVNYCPLHVSPVDISNSVEMGA